MEIPPLENNMRRKRIKRLDITHGLYFVRIIFIVILSVYTEFYLSSFAYLKCIKMNIFCVEHGKADNPDVFTNPNTLHVILLMRCLMFSTLSVPVVGTSSSQ